MQVPHTLLQKPGAVLSLRPSTQQLAAAAISLPEHCSLEHATNVPTYQPTNQLPPPAAHVLAQLRHDVRNAAMGLPAAELPQNSSVGAAAAASASHCLVTLLVRSRRPSDNVDSQLPAIVPGWST